MLQTLLQRRSNGYYYFRWVCPPAISKLLGKREIIKSLRTTSKIQALARAGKYYAAVDQLKAAQEQVCGIVPAEVMQWNLFNYSGGCVSDLRKEALKAQTAINNYLESSFAKALLSKDYSNPITGLDLSSIDRIDDGQLINLTCNQKQFCTMVCIDHASYFIARLLAVSEEYLPASFNDAREKKESVKQLLVMYRAAKTNQLGEVAEGVTIYQLIEQLYELHPKLEFLKPLSNVMRVFPEIQAVYLKVLGDSIYQVLLTLQKKLDPALADAAISELFKKKTGDIVRAPVGTPKSKLLSVLIEEFMAQKISEGLVLEDQKEYRSYFPAILHFVGDIPIDTITKRQIKACLSKFLLLPRRNKNPYKKMSLLQLVECEVPEQDRLSSKTVEGVMKLIQGIFRIAIDQEYLSQSPANDLNLDLGKVNPRGAYSKTQIRGMLNAVSTMKGANEWKKWVLRLAVYSGARAGEIAQLRAEDVKTDSDSGIQYLLITPKAGRIKTENAFRQIPLHSELIGMGFLGFIAGKEGRIFPDLKGSKTISAWFPLFRAEVNIPPETEFGESLVFHSFRHSMVTLLRGGNANDAQVQQIVGHEKTGAGITDRYTQRIPLPDLKRVIELFQI